MELALEVQVHMSQPQGMRAGKLTLLPAHGGIGVLSQSSAGEITLVLQIRESRYTDRVGYHSGPDPSGPTSSVSSWDK